jgi:biopolymer transport protein ExbD
MARRSTEEIGMNMTPMIDVVFQLMIFFLVTIDLDKQIINQTIMLSKSPHGPAIEKRDPRTVVVEIDEKGRVSISQTRISLGFLTTVLRNAVANHGSSTPVQIRADLNAKHEAVREVMEACGKAGVWRVSFVATKESAAEADARRGSSR